MDVPQYECCSVAVNKLYYKNRHIVTVTVKPASNGTCMKRNTVHIRKFSWSHELWHNINVNLPGYNGNGMLFYSFNRKILRKKCFLHIVAGSSVKHSTMTEHPS